MSLWSLRPEARSILWYAHCTLIQHTLHWSSTLYTDPAHHLLGKTDSIHRQLKAFSQQQINALGDSCIKYKLFQLCCFCFCCGLYLMILQSLTVASESLTVITRAKTGSFNNNYRGWNKFQTVFLLLCNTTSKCSNVSVRTGPSSDYTTQICTTMATALLLSSTL